MKKENWKKEGIYNFIEWCKDSLDTENIYDIFYNCNLNKQINDYISACNYDYEDFKEIEKHTLEELECFLKDVFL